MFRATGLDDCMQAGLDKLDVGYTGAPQRPHRAGGHAGRIDVGAVAPAAVAYGVRRAGIARDLRLIKLGLAHFSGLAGKPECPQILREDALDRLSAVGATCGASR